MLLCKLIGHKPEPSMTTFQGRTPADDRCSIRIVCSRCKTELGEPEAATPRDMAERVIRP